MDVLKNSSKFLNNTYTADNWTSIPKERALLLGCMVGI